MAAGGATSSLAPARTSIPSSITDTGSISGRRTAGRVPAAIGPARMVRISRCVSLSAPRSWTRTIRRCSPTSPVPASGSSLLRGADGGFGNAHYKSSTNRAPRRADPGWPGREAWVWLRLKLIADAGLVGLPNAGKSTFLAAVSHARPKIADYPFTTLKPQLGVVRLHDEEFVMADLPGLIEGASERAGIGTRFLGHVERCAVILHLVDGTLEDVAAAYRTIRQELVHYGHGLAEKPEIVGLNKIDALDAAEVIATCRHLQRAAGPGTPVLPLSGATGSGVPKALDTTFATLSAARAPDDAETKSLAAAP